MLSGSLPDFITFLLEIVFTRAAPAFDNLFMGCVINTVQKTERLIMYNHTVLY